MLVLFVMSFILQALSVLVRAVVENIADADGEPAFRLRPKLLELFGHITSKVTNSADIWRLYAELLATSNSLTDPLHERVSRICAFSFMCMKTCVFHLYHQLLGTITYQPLEFFLNCPFFCHCDGPQ